MMSSSSPSTAITTRANARIGLMGNPSDGFNGKTISFLIKNFEASVTVVPSPSLVLQPHLDHDTNEYATLKHLYNETSVKGYYGGLRLLKATCKVFFELCTKANMDMTTILHKNFTMTYDTNIPRMVGLSGSSALIVAAFRSLLCFYDISIDDLSISQEYFPQVILDIEKNELRINAGLQDRVIQVYGGLVHMDFSKEYFEAKGTGTYTKLDASLLPNLYLVYCIDVGSDSGQVHSTVKERWQRRDPELVEGMKFLGSLADKAKQCLQNSRDCNVLSDLMDQNFAMRRKLYGDQVVGAKNIQCIELANSLGMAAKFTGSGGAMICLPRRKQSGWLDDVVEATATEKFREMGFSMIRIEPSNENI